MPHPPCGCPRAPTATCASLFSPVSVVLFVVFVISHFSPTPKKKRAQHERMRAQEREWDRLAATSQQRWLHRRHGVEWWVCCKDGKGERHAPAFPAVGNTVMGSVWTHAAGVSHREGVGLCCWYGSLPPSSRPTCQPHHQALTPSCVLQQGGRAWHTGTEGGAHDATPSRALYAIAARTPCGRTSAAVYRLRPLSRLPPLLVTTPSSLFVSLSHPQPHYRAKHRNKQATNTDARLGAGEEGS